MVGIGREGSVVQAIQEDAQEESIKPAAKKRGRPKKVEVQEVKEPPKKRGRQLGASKVLTASPERMKLYEKSLNQKPSNKKSYKVQVAIGGKENQPVVSELPLNDVSKTLVEKKPKKLVKKTLQKVDEKKVTKKLMKDKSNFDPDSVSVLPSVMRKSIRKIKQEKFAT